MLHNKVAKTHRTSDFAWVMLVLVGFSAFGACVSRRSGLSRDALERDYATPRPDDLPTVAELLTLRVPPVASAPTTLRSGPGAAFAKGEVVVAGAEHDALACLSADARRDYDTLVRRCLDFAERNPADPRAVVAVRIVTRHLGSLNENARLALFTRTEKLSESCASKKGSLSCAELALVVDDARRQAAVDETAEATLKTTSLWQLRGVAEGPFVAADDAFAGSPFDGEPLKKHPKYRVFDVADRSDSGAGTLVPSYRDVEGWWRVTVRGSSDDVDAVIALRGSGPLEVRIDNTPVLVRPRGTLVAELERIPIHLQKGLHTIEVLSWETGGGVRVAVVGRNGMSALTPVARQKWGKNAGAEKNENDDGVVAALALPSTLDPADTDALATLLFRHVMARGGIGQNVDDERVLARLLIKYFGWSPVALVAAAQTIEDDALPDRTAAALAAPLWLGVQATWPDNPVALLSQARMAAAARPDDALAAWRSVVRARPDYAIGHRELIHALLDHDVIDEALASATALLALGRTPENIEPAARALRAAGQMSRALALSDLANSGKEERWRQSLRRGDTESVKRALLARTGEGDDAVIESVLNLVEIADPTTAAQLLEQTLRRHPGDRKLLLRREQLGVVVRKGGTAGIESQAFAPTSTIDLDGLFWREAQGLAVPWTPRLRSGDAVIAQRRKSPSEPWPGFASVFLQDDRERRFAEDGTSLVIRHWIAELRSKEALDGFGELQTSTGERLLRLRVIKQDGRIIEPERHSNVDDLSLPGLATGDIVEWLSVEADNALVDGTFWESRSLRQSTPASSRRYVLSVPKSLAERVSLRVVSKNGAPAPVVVDAIDNGVEVSNYAFEFSGPPLLDEPQSVDREEVEPMVGVIASVDDRFFQRLRRGDFSSRTRIDPWLSEAAALIAGRGSDDEKLQRIFSFVARDITAASSPQDAVGVLAAGTGQKLPLFVALARAAGLVVSVHAVHAPSSVPLTSPTAGSWQGVVVKIAGGEADNGDGWGHALWFADKVALLDRLPPVFGGSLTLDLDVGKRGRLPDRFIEQMPVTLEVNLALAQTSASATLGGPTALRLPAYVGDAFRAGLQAATEAQLGQFMEAALAASLPGVKASKVRVLGLDDAAGPLALVADVEVPLSEGNVRLEHLFAGGVAAAFRAGSNVQGLLRVADRQRPLLTLPEAERLVFQLRLPPSASFIEVPPSEEIVAGPVTLQQKSTVEDGLLVWERNLIRSAARVSLRDWAQVRAALGPLVSRTDARVAFVAALPTSEVAEGAKEAAAAQTR